MKKLILYTCIFLKGVLSGDFTNFNIALKQNNIDLLKERLLDISNPYSENYGKYYDIETIQKIVSPDKKENEGLINWLENNNITILNNYGDSLHCQGGN